jgi:hypothetical protein
MYLLVLLTGTDISHTPESGWTMNEEGRERGGREER